MFLSGTVSCEQSTIFLLLIEKSLVVRSWQVIYYLCSAACNAKHKIKCLLLL